MGGGVILAVILFMVSVSIVIQYFAPNLGININYSLLDRKETYLALFTLFTV